MPFCKLQSTDLKRATHHPEFQQVAIYKDLSHFVRVVFNLLNLHGPGKHTISGI